MKNISSPTPVNDQLDYKRTSGKIALFSGLIFAAVNLLYQVYKGDVRELDVLIGITTTALILSIPSYLISRIYRHFKLNPRYELLVILFVIFCLLFLVGNMFLLPSSPATQTGMVSTQTVQPTKTQYPTDVPVADSDICKWFIKTQFIRSQRISGLSEFNEWYQRYGAEGLISSNESGFEELAGVLRRYQPYQKQFVEAWIELGAHPGAKEFWEKELSSVQLRIQAFDQMIKGIEEDNMDIYNDGLITFNKAAQIGQEAESAMLVIRSKCIP